jgi:peptide/nickel transport system substrate-binding protein
MRVDQAPFNDERVRQAMRLLIDREALIESVYSGYGKVGNDLFGRGLPFYASDLPQRTQDVEQAKSLLKSAGASDLRFTLQTSPVAAGFVEAATAFAQQCKEAGVTVQVKREQPASYFNPTLLYLKMPFAQTIWPVSSLASIYSSALVSGAPTNETHYSDKTFDELFLQAQGATDEGEATELWGQVQKMQYDSGGYINWANAQSVAGIAPTVRGIGGPGSGWLQNLDDFRVWNWGLVA